MQHMVTVDVKDEDYNNLVMHFAQVLHWGAATMAAKS
jgi:hypothetical protein